jgi:hypothetical protein
MKDFFTNLFAKTKKAQEALQRVTVAILCMFRRIGSNQSSDEIHVGADANPLFNSLKFKIRSLKRPIYYSGTFLCLLVLITFTSTISANSKELLVKEKDNKLISSPSDTIIPVLIEKGSLSNLEYMNYLIGRNIVIKTSTEWEHLKTYLSEITFHETNIDFSTYHVLAIFDKSSAGSGTTIDITAIWEYADSIVVRLSNLQKTIVSNVVLPFHIVKVPRFDKKIVFEYESRKEE